MKENLLKALAWVLAGLALAAVLTVTRGFGQAESLAEQLRLLSDGFFVAAAILLAWGGLTWTTNGGAVDGLGYSMKTLKDRLLPNPRYKRQESFADYRRRKHEKDTSPVPMLLAGALHLVIAVVLVTAYSRHVM